MVLHWGDSTFGNPIDSGGKRLAIVGVHTNFWETSFGRSDVATDREGLELLECQICELVDSLFVSLGLIRIVSLHAKTIKPP